MSSDTDEPTAKVTEQETTAEANRMQARLEELDDHVDEAKKKAKETSAPPAKEPDEDDLGAVDEPPTA